MNHKGWIGVDLDGTLAHYDHWRGPSHIGEPIVLMLERVKRWLVEGREVRIFTARVFEDQGGIASANIKLWCEKHIGKMLPITCTKDYGMIELWDDRCVQVVPNSGRTIAETISPQIIVCATCGDPLGKLAVARSLRCRAGEP